MIQINCNNCKALLQIDDAFAGGVCRCRYCGTIQTVPKHLKQAANGEQAPVSASAAAAAELRSKVRTLYKKKTGPRGEGLGGSGSGLDELANIVASSGLASGQVAKRGLTQPQPAADPNAPRPMDRKTIMIVAGAGGVIVLLLGIIIAMAVSDKSQPAGGNRGGGLPGASAAGGTQTDGTPRLFGQPLDFDSVAFVLDRGQGTIDDGRLEHLKTAIFRTLQNFGDNRRFSVIFWDRDGEVWAFPRDGLAQANKANINALWIDMQNVFSGGATEPQKALKRAVDSGAQAIVFVPVKGFVDDDFDRAVASALSGARTRLFCFSLGQSHLEPVLRKFAAQTGGAYRDVPLHELREAAGR